jgi:cell division protease FtsH
MAHALLDWETIDKFQIDELMQGRTIAPPEPEIVEAPSFNDGEIQQENTGAEPLAVS